MISVEIVRQFCGNYINSSPSTTRYQMSYKHFRNLKKYESVSLIAMKLVQDNNNERVPLTVRHCGVVLRLIAVVAAPAATKRYGEELVARTRRNGEASG